MAEREVFVVAGPPDGGYRFYGTDEADAVAALDRFDTEDALTLYVVRVDVAKDGWFWMEGGRTHTYAGVRAGSSQAVALAEMLADARVVAEKCRGGVAIRAREASPYG